MTEFRTARYHDGYAWRCALVREGRTRLHVVTLEETGIRHASVARSEVRMLRPIPYRGAEYPVRRMVRHFRAFGRERGITQAALEELRAAEAQA